MKKLTLLLCAVLVTSTYAQETQALLEPVVAKTALKKRPNILFAIADDMSHASVYGHKWVSTRHFDKLASEGILSKRNA